MDVIVGGVFDIAPMRPARRRSAIVLENTVSDVDVAALAELIGRGERDGCLRESDIEEAAERVSLDPLALEALRNRLANRGRVSIPPEAGRRRRRGNVATPSADRAMLT
jgi:hypothetical protein